MHNVPSNLYLDVRLKKNGTSVAQSSSKCGRHLYSPSQRCLHFIFLLTVLHIFHVFFIDFCWTETLFQLFFRILFWFIHRDFNVSFNIALVLVALDIMLLCTTFHSLLVVSFYHFKYKDLFYLYIPFFSIFIL